MVVLKRLPELRVALTNKEDDGRLLVRGIREVDAYGDIIPVDFISDFASIPKFAQGVFPVVERGNAVPAYVHDFKCWMGVDRAVRSKLYYEMMRAYKEPKWAAYIQYLAVRYWPGSEQVRFEKIHRLQLDHVKALYRR